MGDTRSTSTFSAPAAGGGRIAAFRSTPLWLSYDFADDTSRIGTCHP